MFNVKLVIDNNYYFLVVFVVIGTMECVVVLCLFLIVQVLSYMYAHVEILC